MNEKRRQSKAIKELEETKILVDYLLQHRLDFDDISNFSDVVVRKAIEWNSEEFH